MLELLLSRGGDASIECDSGSNPLHHLPAFEDESIQSITQVLASNGTDANGQNVIGMTSLRYAVRGSDNEEEPTVNVLLGLGANPLMSDKDETPLDAAVYMI